MKIKELHSTNIWRTVPIHVYVFFFILYCLLSCLSWIVSIKQITVNQYIHEVNAMMSIVQLYSCNNTNTKTWNYNTTHNHYNNHNDGHKPAKWTFRYCNMVCHKPEHQRDWPQYDPHPWVVWVWFKKLFLSGTFLAVSSEPGTYSIIPQDMIIGSHS